MAEYTDDLNLNGWSSSVDLDYTEDILRSLDRTTGRYRLPEDFDGDDFQIQALDLVNETMGSDVANYFSDADSSELIDIELSNDTVDTRSNSSALTRSTTDSDSNCYTKRCRRAKAEFCFKGSESVFSDDAICAVGSLSRLNGTVRKCDKRPYLKQRSHSRFRQSSETLHNKTTGLSSNQTNHKTLCMTQNAVNARQNRMKKKQYEEELENTVEQLKNENTELRKKFDEQTEIVQNLSTQVEYLNKVVANADKLGMLLQNIPSYLSGSSKFSENTLITKKLASISEFEKLECRYRDTNQDDRNKVELDHSYACLQSRDEHSEAGVCLHVATNGLAVEMCAICSQSAQKTFSYLRNSR